MINIIKNFWQGTVAVLRYFRRSGRSYKERIRTAEAQKLQEAFFERVLEARLLDVYEAFQDSQRKMIFAVLDKISDIESLQMELLKIQSGLTKKLFPDYVSEREQASRGYHEVNLN